MLPFNSERTIYSLQFNSCTHFMFLTYRKKEEEEESPCEKLNKQTVGISVFLKPFPWFVLSWMFYPHHNPPKQILSLKNQFISILTAIRSPCFWGYTHNFRFRLPTMIHKHARTNTHKHVLNQFHPSYATNQCTIMQGGIVRRLHCCLLDFSDFFSLPFRGLVLS